MAVESLTPPPPRPRKIQASHFIEPKASKSTVAFAVKTFTGAVNQRIWVTGLVFCSFLILPSPVRKVRSDCAHTHIHTRKKNTTMWGVWVFTSNFHLGSKVLLKRAVLDLSRGGFSSCLFPSFSQKVTISTLRLTNSPRQASLSDW